MNFHFKKSLLFVPLFFITCITQATTRKVLFIGDSYIYVNNMPFMLQSLAAALGDTLIYQESDPGGYSFMQHSTYAPTIAAIFAQQWDVVVMQEQSERPAFPPSQVATDTYPYARKLDSLVHANDSCTQTMFLMTWGHANGDPPNCPFYPVICTYLGMQARLIQSYMQMTQDNRATVAPLGIAWKEVRDSFPALWLYQADSIHASVAGSYLEACVLYNSIFHKGTYGTSYTDGLAPTDANTLQHFADKTGLDSLDQWQQYGHYPTADFSYTLSGNQVTFNKLLTSHAKYIWQFGDGSSDTTTDPIQSIVHTYAADGTYIVSNTAITKCFSETITDTININRTGIENIGEGSPYPIHAIQTGSGNITFILPKQRVYTTLEVYDGSGRLVKVYTIDGNMIKDNLVPGFYIFRAYSANRKLNTYNKMIVY